MPTLVMPVGLPGCGKTTRAVEWVAASFATRWRVNRDTLREMAHGGRLGTGDQEWQVTVAQRAQVEALLRAGVDVVVDDTNLYPEHRDAWRELAARCGAELQVWDMTATPLEVCIDRDAGRPPEQRVGEEVIRRMARRLGAVRPKKGSARVDR